MQSIDTRLANVQSFLQKIRREGIEYKVVKITDDYGPTIEDGSLQALVGSKETLKGCESGKSQRFLVMKS